ncbi:MAG: hypothetical protein PHH77_05770, partial [Victivallaceae bacterium]|nr:hypothetical protein [Victivallaceae bacterium]
LCILSSVAGLSDGHIALRQQRSTALHKSPRSCRPYRLDSTLGYFFTYGKRKYNVTCEINLAIIGNETIL